jgi:hypothetical protein
MTGGQRARRGAAAAARRHAAARRTYAQPSMHAPHASCIRVHVCMQPLLYMQYIRTYATSQTDVVSRQIAPSLQQIGIGRTSQTDVVSRQQAPSLQQIGIGSSAECAHDAI